MFDHSIKVPRLYKTSAKIYKDLQNNKGSIKQLVYQSKHQNIKALYALVVETHKRRNELDILLNKSELTTKEPRLDPILARILLTELLWGKQRLSGESKPVKTVLAYEHIFRSHVADVAQNNSFQKGPEVNKPRYVRINTLMLSINEAVDGFQDEEWNIVRFNDKQDYKGFLEAVKSLGEYDFLVDIHIPDLLVFHPRTQFYNHTAYQEGQIILQDKASCLPAFILKPEQGSTVLDMCAAPGMKTTHLAALMNNQGTIFAVEFDQKRAEVLQNMLESTGVTCAKTINRDVLTITDKECPNVEYILVDPSCSGTGIIDRLDIEEADSKDQQYRISKLAGFQIKILRHALTRFPFAKRVVYSTCSLNVEENEDVVRQVLETCTTFKLVPAKKFLNNIWLNFGSSDFGNLGKYCLYTRPETDLTNGFFIAVFERLEEGQENEFLNKHSIKRIKTKKDKCVKDSNHPHIQHETITEKADSNKTFEQGSSSKKRKKTKPQKNTDDYINNESTIVENFEPCPIKKKKKKRKENEADDSRASQDNKDKNYDNRNQLLEDAYKSGSGVKSKHKNKNIPHIQDVHDIREDIKVDSTSFSTEEIERDRETQIAAVSHIENKKKKNRLKSSKEDNFIDPTLNSHIDGRKRKKHFTDSEQIYTDCQNIVENDQRRFLETNGNNTLSLASGNVSAAEDNVKRKKEKTKKKKKVNN